MADETTEQIRRPPPTPERRLQRHESRTGATYKAFLKDLCEIGGFDMKLAECAAVSVLCAFEQRVYAEGAKEDLEAQLPMKLRELLQRCELHLDAPHHRFGKEELFQMVADDLKKDPSEAEPIVRAVLGAVRDQISDGEAEDFIAMLPMDMKELWLRPV